ncbi:MAG: hypothetical protein HC850_01230, partial [Rhodomicrobium sp.]|nr:hypothetical protein [Rhodomicrobium sp.]
MNRVADLIAQTLHAHGVRLAFGMPGGEVVTLIDALEKAGIRFVLCRHETAAAIMAAGASAITGAPGLLVTTLGPGFTNAVNGIADAAQEHAPLIVMSGVVEHGLRGALHPSDFPAGRARRAHRQGRVRDRDQRR